MEIKEFFRSKDRTHWLAMIQTCDWPAGQFLYELLTTNQIHKFCGETCETVSFDRWHKTCGILYLIGCR